MTQFSMHRLTHFSLPLLLLPLLSACGISPVADSTVDVVETSVTVPSRGIEIPGTLTSPAVMPEPLPLVVLAHGHGSSRDEAGSFSRLADELAARGIASIRIDFPGCGESREPFTANNLSNMLEDLLAARRHASRALPVDPQRVAVHGYSMGARIALLATRRAEWAAVSTWAPVADNGEEAILAFLGGRDRWDELSKAAAEKGSTPLVTPWGQRHELGRQWFRDMAVSKPLAAAADYGGSLLAICGSRDFVAAPDVCRRLSRAAGADPVEIVVLDGADHGLGFYTGETHLAERTLSTTVDFLAAALADRNTRSASF